MYDALAPQGKVDVACYNNYPCHCILSPGENYARQSTAIGHSIVQRIATKAYMLWYELIDNLISINEL